MTLIHFSGPSQPADEGNISDDGGWGWQTHYSHICSAATDLEDRSDRCSFAISLWAAAWETRVKPQSFSGKLRRSQATMTVLRLSLKISPPSPLQAFLHRCELSLWGPIQRAESISEPLSSGSDSQQLMHIMQFVPTAMLFVQIIPLILASLGPKKNPMYLNLIRPCFLQNLTILSLALIWTFSSVIIALGVTSALALTVW